jgi:hypothetical protein
MFTFFIIAFYEYKKQDRFLYPVYYTIFIYSTRLGDPLSGPMLAETSEVAYESTAAPTDTPARVCQSALNTSKKAFAADKDKNV